VARAVAQGANGCNPYVLETLWLCLRGECACRIRPPAVGSDLLAITSLRSLAASTACSWQTEPAHTSPRKAWKRDGLLQDEPLPVGH
jgi:hypothetical protein